MNLDITKNSLKFEIPHSRMIDKIISMRDNTLPIEYLNTYELRTLHGIEYIFPIFSVCGVIYYLYYDSTHYYRLINTAFSIRSDLYDNVILKKADKYNYMFYNLNISKENFEEMLLNAIRDSDTILKILLA